MNAIDRDSWAVRRFEWKKAINRSHEPSRGAKQLASFLCDEFVNRNTGRCWPGNRTLAEGLGVNTRTIQRYLAELVERRWVRLVKVKGRRRTIQIQFPAADEGDNEDDNGSRANRTNLSPENDMVVVHHKNQGKKQIRPGREPLRMGSVLVQDNEATSICSWLTWIESKTSANPAEVLGRFKRKEGYDLPGRYPAENGARDEEYARYFGLP